MLPRRVGPVALAAAVLLLPAAGCAPPPADVPQFDFTTSPTYRTEEFKDDAPANARVAGADFPHSFVAADGTPVDLTAYRGRQKVVLVVLRGIPRADNGVFCPTCLAQAGSLMANQAEFARRKAEILVVFPGPSDRLGEFLQRAKDHATGDPAPGFRVLLDRDCSACDRLGIRDDLAKPSTYILDTRGNVVYAYVGETSTDRPSVKAILAQLDKAR